MKQADVRLQERLDLVKTINALIVSMSAPKQVPAKIKH
jgi:hypothetical protein